MVLFGPFLWRQLEGRCSALLSVAPARSHLFGSTDPDFPTEKIADQLRPILRHITEPTVTDVLPALGHVNLACVPMPPGTGGTLVAFISTTQIESRYLHDLERKNIVAAVVDHAGTVVAGTNSKLAGTHLQAFRRPSTQPVDAHEPWS